MILTAKLLYSDEEIELAKKCVLYIKQQILKLSNCIQEDQKIII